MASTQPEILCSVEAIYSFHSDETSTLNFDRGDQIEVFTKLETGWWNGWCKGKRGWFPSNYVEIISEEPILNKKSYQPKSSYRASSIHSSASSEYSRRSNLPDNWAMQNNDHAVYYFNEQNGQHPSYNDENTIISDHNKRDSFTAQSDSDLYENNATQISKEELMENWVERKTPQGRSYFCNLITQETTWDHDEIDPETGHLKKTQDEKDQRPINNDKKSITDTDTITWNKLSSDIALAIHQLVSTFQHNQQDEFHTKTSDVIKSIRVMLYASRSLEKDAPLLHNPIFREPRKMVISSLSKLVISSKMSSEVQYDSNTPPVIFQKFQRDANDVLVAVRNFVNIYTQHNVPVYHVNPKLIDDTSQLPFDLPNQENKASLDSSKRSSFNLDFDGSTTPKTKFLLNQDLISNLQAYANQIIKSIDALSSMISASLREHKQTQEERDSSVAMFRTLSLQISQLGGVLDEINFENVNVNTASFATYRSNRQSLYESIGLLFSAIQSMTDSHINIETSARVVDESLTKVGNALENIEQTIVMMVGERKRTLSVSQHVRKLSVDSEEQVQRKFSVRQVVQEEERADDNIEYGNDNTVRGGTLVALVERLTAHDIFDTNFITTFLLTYRSFCTTEEFIELLEDRYNILPPENLTPEELEAWTERKQKLIRLRVFNVLKNWLENYYIDEDNYLLDRIEHFTNTNIRDSSSFAANQLLRIIRKRIELCSQGEMKKIVPNPISGPEPIYPKNMTRIQLLDTDPLEMARQLSVMDFKLYSSIRPIECLGKAWSKEDLDIAANIRQSIQYCNRLTTWVTESILHSEETRRRAIVIKYWVQVADNCREMNNFNTCMAILSAFDNSAIGRLRKTWMLVSRNTTQVLTQLRKLMGANRNFSEYRDIIHSINPPCIPFLGIYLQDLTFIEDGNPDFLRSSDKLINFSKRHKTAEVIRELKQFQSFAYNFHTILEFQNFIQSRLDLIYDIDKLYERSLKLEPRSNETSSNSY